MKSMPQALRTLPMPRFALRTLLLLTLFAAILAASLGSPTLEYVKERRVAKFVSDRGGTVVAESPEQNRWAQKIARWFGNSELFDRIVEVDVSGSTVTDDDLDLLCAPKNLERLLLANTRITDAGAGTIAECERLREVDVSGTEVTNVFLQSFQSSQVHFGTRNTQITYGELKKISLPSVTARLEHCAKPGVRRSDGGFHHLYYYVNDPLAVEGMQDLIRFQCDDPKLSVAVHFYEDVANAAWIERCCTLKRLTSLHAQSSNLSDTDLQAIADCPYLKEVRIFSPQLTSACLTYVRPLSRLEVLQLPSSAKPGDLYAWRPQFAMLREVRFFPDEAPSLTMDE